MTILNRRLTVLIFFFIYKNYLGAWECLSVKIEGLEKKIEYVKFTSAI